MQNSARRYAPVFTITAVLFTVVVLAPVGLKATAQESQVSGSRATSRDVSRDGVPRRNVVLILSDDHRYDFMGFA
ncbi:MAG: hypothetical protein ACYSWU_03160, partial [Planctomycetota bacterium]